MKVRAPRAWPAIAVAFGSGLVWWIWGPITGDEHAARLRTWLVERGGVTIWSLRWFAGHHLPGYGIVLPAVARFVGLRPLSVALVIAAAACGADLLRRHFPRSSLPSVWLALGLTANLWSGRLTFSAGVAVALGALTAFDRRRWWTAGILATLAAAASPLAGLFLGMIAATWLWSHRSSFARSLWPACSLGAGPFVVIVASAVLFPEGGWLPFAWTALAGSLLACVLVAVVAGRDRPLIMSVALLIVGASLVLFVVRTPIGANIGRLPLLAAGPVAAALLLDRQRVRWLVLAGVPLAVWQFTWPVTDAIKAAVDVSNHAAYFAPLLHEALRLPMPAGGGRIEVVPLRSKADADWVARAMPIARGWERQVDYERQPFLYSPTINPDQYVAWLHDRAVAYVAVADAPLDEGGRSEAKLLARGVPSLTEVWHDAHWQLYQVADPTPIVDPPGRLVDAGIDSLTIDVTTPGDVGVNMTDSRWMTVTGGDACIAGRGAGRVTLRVRAVGRLVLRVQLFGGGTGDC